MFLKATLSIQTDSSKVACKQQITIFSYGLFRLYQAAFYSWPCTQFSIHAYRRDWMNLQYQLLYSDRPHPQLS